MDLRAAAVALVLATPVATWWVVGDLDEKGADLDYMVRPPDIPPVVEALTGVLAVVVVVASAAVLGAAAYRRRVPRGWWGTVVPLCAAGLIVGGGWRVVTAGSIGANIGGGLVLLFGFPLAALLVLGAVLDSRR